MQCYHYCCCIELAMILGNSSVCMRSLECSQISTATSWCCGWEIFGVLPGPIDLLGYVLPDHPGSPSPDLLGGPGGLAERSSRISGRSCWTDRELLEDLLDALGLGRHKSGIRAAYDCRSQPCRMAIEFKIILYTTKKSKRFFLI